MLGVLGQAVAAVTEAGVVVVAADTRVQAYAFDDLPGIQAMGFGVAVQFVKVGHAHRQVGVGEQLDGFGFGAVGEEGGDVLLDGALLQQAGECFRTLGAFADDDPRRIQVVVQRLAFAQELRREENVSGVVLLSHALGVADRDCGFDHHDRVRVDRQDILDHRLDAAGVEEVGFRIVIGGGGDDHEVGTAVGLYLVEGRPEIEGLLGEIPLDLAVLDGRQAIVDQVDLGRNDVQGDYPVVLGEQHCVGESDVAGSGDGDVHFWIMFLGFSLMSYCWFTGKAIV